jgi:hypothetical protein
MTTNDRTIHIKLRDIIQSNEAIEALGLNPWCVNEGADGDALIEVKLEDARKWNLV